MDSLQYAIIGSGGIGGFYGGMLAKAGKKVDFLFHSDYEYVKENGLKIDSVCGNFHLHSVSAFNVATAMNPADVVLVCLKTTNNFLLKEMLPPLLKKETLVVLIQNGLGVEDDVQKDFPDLYIAGGLAFICTQKTGPGHICHLDYGKLTLGAFSSGCDVMLWRVYDDMKEAGIKAEIAEDLQSARWRKLVWNIPYNGSTVVLNTSTRSLMDNKDSRELMKELMEEVVSGANACGIKYPIESFFISQMLDMTDNMASYSPSMKLDYDYQREMEIEYIYSRPLKLALNAGINMKKVAVLEKQLRFIQSTFTK